MQVCPARRTELGNLHVDLVYLTTPPAEVTSSSARELSNSSSPLGNRTGLPDGLSFYCEGSYALFLDLQRGNPELVI